MVDRYIDRANADAFFQADGHEVEASVLMRVPPAIAFSKWVDRCWFDGGKKPPKELKAGDVRETIHGTERVIAVAPPKSDGSGSIGSLHFNLIAQGTWIESYQAMVSFIPDRSNPANTLVLWDVKFEPSRTSVLVCCGGTILRMLMRNHMQNMLKNID
ncbi:hypothetical protein AeNC1_003562 [Aphanomyces euteiches]|nr:hypothetical protein AeNC1_003562 [Aphanomyces euteiches]